MESQDHIKLRLPDELLCYLDHELDWKGEHPGLNRQACKELTG